MLGVAAQRIVHPIRKPRNKADEAIAPKPEGTGLICQLRGRSAVAPLAHGGLPWASRRFVHLIPESRRRGHAGLVQRFPKRRGAWQCGGLRYNLPLLEERCNRRP